jgi:hypothetical protein
MTWDTETLQLEIAVEFQRFTPQPYDALVERFWRARQYTDRNWGDYGQWWRKTTAGKKYFREYSQRRAALLKSIELEIRWCVACGKEFTVTAYQAQRKRGRVCSTECRGAARKNIKRHTINGQTKTLTEWCAEFGVKLQTACRRIGLGWPIEAAVGAVPRRAA